MLDKHEPLVPKFTTLMRCLAEDAQLEVHVANNTSFPDFLRACIASRTPDGTITGFSEATGLHRQFLVALLGKPYPLRRKLGSMLGDNRYAIIAKEFGMNEEHFLYLVRGLQEQKCLQAKVARKAIKTERQKRRKKQAQSSSPKIPPAFSESSAHLRTREARLQIIDLLECPPLNDPADQAAREQLLEEILIEHANRMRELGKDPE